MSTHTIDTIDLISAGAAKGLFTAGTDALRTSASVVCRGRFGAVGAMRERLLAGDACDLVVLTRPMLEALAADGQVDGTTIRPLGDVRTGVAVRVGQPFPDVTDPDHFRANLLAASGLWVPDTERSTAGRHVASMLEQMGIAPSMKARLRAFDNGSLAMADLAASTAPLALGITQVTEILYTPGVRLVGVLPAQYELSTEYAAAVRAGSRQRDAALRCLDWLTGNGAAALRRDGGFELSD